jgi:tetratricopeptide (TPR) repeat protein
MSGRRSVRGSIAGAIALVGCLAVGLPAQQSGARRWVDSARAVLPAAVSLGDTAALKATELMLRRALTAHADDPWLQYYLAYTLYRAGSGRGQGAAAVFMEVDSLLRRSIRTLNLAESHALRATALGMQIRDQESGMRLGPMADEAMRTALSIAPKNPRVLLLHGLSQFHTPRDYGGGADKAEATLKAAIDAMASDKPVPPHPDGWHAETYAWLGVVYTKTGKRDLARAAFNKSLSIDPNFRWVSHVLLPGLDKPSP